MKNFNSQLSSNYLVDLLRTGDGGVLQESTESSVLLNDLRESLQLVLNTVQSTSLAFHN